MDDKLLGYASLRSLGISWDFVGIRVAELGFRDERFVFRVWGLGFKDQGRGT